MRSGARVLITTPNGRHMAEMNSISSSPIDGYVFTVMDPATGTYRLITAAGIRSAFSAYYIFTLNRTKT